MKRLTIAGTGIKFLAHLTTEVKGIIKSSSCVLYLLNEPAMKHWVLNNSKISFSLDEIYYSCEKRIDAYEKIVQVVLSYAGKYNDLVLLIYGHPLVFSSVAMKLIEQCSNSEMQLSVLPGISALDCLLADLRIDPAGAGLQCYDATLFINKNVEYSSSAHLILWQIAIVNEIKIIKGEINKVTQKTGLSYLKKILLNKYSANHPLILYVAALYAGVSSEIIELELDSLEEIEIPRLATLYIPPLCS
ncbi:SAM-dependent methyltransferase [Legionella jordanis]|uniref:Methylase n=1 Tax=Legionella jordanis TaxID=456 RepID=A0A0W0VCU0_9GAMM|nr:SAM-dependent methyltransferase [Legionella jordanis]KTD17920.1 methylase [Legionella jordanis]RMX02382.1 hypothetical protein EAW55_09030 [Legionella jordanis]RMX21776.1 hypothetical protein EAS68_03195 [Legionella jordanis]VEH13989.1 Uncharacterized protein yabN [Legionella jordanis]